MQAPPDPPHGAHSSPACGTADPGPCTPGPGPRAPSRPGSAPAVRPSGGSCWAHRGPSAGQGAAPHERPPHTCAVPCRPVRPGPAGPMLSLRARAVSPGAISWARPSRRPTCARTDRSLRELLSRKQRLRAEFRARRPRRSAIAGAHGVLQRRAARSGSGNRESAL